MSQQSLEQFLEKVAQSEELQSTIGEEIDVESLIALGAEHGFEFTAENLAANAELSDEELDGVAGGLAQTAEGGLKAFKLKIDSFPEEGVSLSDMSEAMVGGTRTLRVVMSSRSW